MFFNKKSKGLKCARCSGKLESKFSFCPYCGASVISKEKMEKDYGLLGREDSIDPVQNVNPMANLGITDKLISNMFNMVMKNLNKQMIDELNGADVQAFPNGIKIRIGSQQPKKKNERMQKKEISQEQLERISSLPRKEAKYSMRRVADKIVYELNMPGVSSADDVFVSKLESGYEIKALGEKNVYVNSIQVELPINHVSLDKNRLIVEFKTEE